MGDGTQHAAILVEPSLEAGPRDEECLVGDLDAGRFREYRPAVAIEDEQATVPEPLDRFRHGFSIVVGLELARPGAPGACRGRRRRR